MFEDLSEYNEFVREVFQRVALEELDNTPFEIVVSDTGVALQIVGDEGHRFSVYIHGDIFEVIYGEDYSHIEFLVDISQDVQELTVEALREIRLVCSGAAQMVATETLVRHKTKYSLATSTGDTWYFYRR